MVKESTIKHNKELVKAAMKENKISNKLSKAERNKLILNEIQSSEPEEKEENEEKPIKKTASRSFKCPDCGWEVILNGTVASDKSITKCSKCSRE